MGRSCLLFGVIFAALIIPVCAQASGRTLEDIDRDIHGWTVHPALSARYGGAVLKVGPEEEDWQVFQWRMDYQALLRYWVAGPWHLSHGLGIGYSWDTDASAGLGRPGMMDLSLDLGFGWMEKPDIDTPLSPGIEVRTGFHYGWINYTALNVLWLRTILRPSLRFLGQHWEVALPLWVDWRRDPVSSPGFGLELGAVL